MFPFKSKEFLKTGVFCICYQMLITNFGIYLAKHRELKASKIASHVKKLRKYLTKKKPKTGSARKPLLTVYIQYQMAERNI